MKDRTSRALTNSEGLGSVATELAQLDRRVRKGRVRASAIAEETRSLELAFRRPQGGPVGASRLQSSLAAYARVEHQDGAAWRGEERADSLVDIWMALAGGMPVPDAIYELRDKLINLPQPNEETGGDGVTNDAGGIEAIIPKSPVGCNNGCCDYDWLATFSQCAGGYDYDWFLWNYGYSSYNGDDKVFYTGLVCSAEGTSTYKVNIASEGGTWSVAEAHYKTWGWLAGFSSIWCAGYCGEDVRSSVNTATNQHLHTYCGGVWND